MDSTSKYLHVAVVDEELPYPMVTGKRIRTMNLLARLASRHRITFISHRNHDADEISPATEYLNNLGVEVVLSDFPAPQQSLLTSRARLYVRLAANLTSARPYLVDLHNTAPLKKLVRQYHAANRVDLWQCEWTPYAESIRHLPDASWVIMAHNVESLIWQRYYETERHRLNRWYIGLQWRKYQRYERTVFGQAKATITVSQEDARLARDMYSARRVAVVDNGVDVEYFQPSGEVRRPATILLLGSLGWRPNVDAVHLMLDQVFPAIRQQIPAAELWIVGRKPAPALVEKIHRHEGVLLHADVPDVRPYLRQASMLAVPLRIGGGSRLKILEALAAETPVVSTQVGAEGLHLIDGEHLVLVDGIDTLASTIVDELRHSARLKMTARRGRQHVVRHYDWSILAEKLDSVWCEVVESKP